MITISFRNVEVNTKRTDRRLANSGLWKARLGMGDRMMMNFFNIIIFNFLNYMLTVYMHYCIMWGTEEFTASSKNLGREEKEPVLR